MYIITKRLFLASLLLIAVLCGFGIGPVQAQSSATGAGIAGTIVNEQGEQIGNATITLRDTSLNPPRVTHSSKIGDFSIVEIPIGLYELKIEADGFTPQVTRLVMELGTVKRVDVTLKTKPPEKAPLQVQEILTGRTDSSTNLNNRQFFDKLPIFLRTYTEFTRITPRATLDRLPLPVGVIPTSRISFNGQSTRSNNLVVDGIDNYDRVTGAFRAPIPSGAVKEFQVLSDSYSAEFGRSTGGVISAVTSGGTNDTYHGAVAAFLGNDSVSARDAFVFYNSFKHFEQYQGNAAIGGPIKKNRLLFLVGGSRVSFNRSNIVAIPDQIVASARSQGYLFSKGPVPFSIGTAGVFARIDAKLSSNDTMWIRYNGGFLYNGAFSPYAFFVSDTASTKQRLKDNSVAISNTYISPAYNLVNETRFFYGRRSQDITLGSTQPQVGIQDIRPTDANANLLINDPLGLSIFGANSLLPQPFQRKFRENLYQIVDNVSMPRGRHMVKFGINYSLFDINATVDQFDLGQALFLPLDFLGPGVPLISGLQSFDPSLRTSAQRVFLQGYAKQLTKDFPGFPLLDLANIPLPTAYGQGFGQKDVDGRLNIFSAFVQDDIKLNRNLLLKVGLRYDISRLRFAPNNNGNFSPRVSISYNPQRLQKLSINASYGLFFGTFVLGPSLPTRLLRDNLRKLFFLPFPYSILPYNLPDRRFPRSDSTQIPTDIPSFPQLGTIPIYDKNLRASYSQQTRLGLEYSLDRLTKLSLTYIFVRGNRLFSAREVNPVVRPVKDDELQSQITGRVDPSTGNTIESESAFDSYYHGLTVGVDRRIAKRFTFFANYTVSKAIDNFADFTAGLRDDALQIDPTKPVSVNNLIPLPEPNVRNERALSLQDVRNRFVFSGIWELSYTKNKFLKDFQFSTIVTLESGRPYNLSKTINILVSRGSIDRPNFRPNGLGRNVGITPGFANVDVRLTRTIVIKERYRFVARIEAFNLMNQVNINGVNGSLLPDAQGQVALPPKEGSRYKATPGQYLSAFPPRQLQFTLSLSF